MKTLLTLFIFCSFFCYSIDDKTKHFYSGFGISIVTAEITNQIIKKPAISSIAGSLFGITAGILKESVYDRYLNKGVCDNKDAYATIWGAVCGGMVIRVRFDLQEKRKEREKINYSFNDLN